MQEGLLSADEALEREHRPDGFGEYSTAFVCPFPDCRVYANHDWGKLTHATVTVENFGRDNRYMEDLDIRCAKCLSCRRETIWIDQKMVRPASSDAPARAADMPSDIHEEYDEAAAIFNLSPRGSAALLRLAVQKLLPILGASKRDINDQIGELVGAGTISRRVSDALDTLRVIGNEAVHPGTIILNDDRATALGLFRLLNFIIEKAITEPKHADDLFAKLPQGKKDGIETRNAHATKQNSQALQP
ncbi:DUF4145 domain-containing protein [Sphingomonas sp. 8AM]|uniref:DUF4145 domain-containing protein n=1 Tax=Sphingomonas sp. 8AM TaxID=2653170 RepID=UPI0012F3C7A8|nr:DUF4145 domain-containing protein [Sphingomonas sp. 8AM]VXC90925.1 conserved hypothetical protein [Sphingomonas sp. 8AM]